MTIFSILIYIAAMTLANISVAHFGPAITPVNAFLFIGLDLTLRNVLSMRIDARGMIALIFSAAAISYLMNPATGQIAIASLVAFSLSALSDWLTFKTIKGQWMRKCLGGVAVGAMVDSLVFPTLAFGTLMPSIVVAQFFAKVVGGYVWAYIAQKAFKINGEVVA